MLFDGFALTSMTVNGVSYRFCLGGSGSLLVLLHGRPETHAMWHKVAPALASHHTVLCPDLHPERSLSQQAEDLLALADSLGHDSLILAGQDYGARVACEVAELEPSRVKALILLEALPGPDHTGRDDMAFSLAQYESCWFGQLHPKPEANAVQIPAEWLDTAPVGDSFFSPEAVKDYLSAPIWRSRTPFSWPVCRPDLHCPVLVLWGAKGRIGGWYNPVLPWEAVSTSMVKGHALPGEHFLPEEAPEETLSAIQDFLTTLPVN
ncbi:alpha/beta fold hydrolase [Acetobacter sp.]|jgi:haloacetate dehalogenase|uniref:alpha/beta fold hydrolase n=1 Tax=Acetobacter sp. TaxID=440 RepID=UPI0025BBBA19|nr:alpha/beta hydrolase [Acetobacter sp.]MCH4090337.1 alpha/beta hydrolase [Acetobacter sp.]MCI1299031.1 alpha/beta hydrolase [Acetobacter sp.]MCI1315051.1 alpha/beta hydrolase [Acetobacter sp.]